VFEKGPKKGGHWDLYNDGGRTLLWLEYVPQVSGVDCLILKVITGGGGEIVGNGTQGLVHARQEFYHVVISSAPKSYVNLRDGNSER
jgi:hypothetical protein